MTIHEKYKGHEIKILLTKTGDGKYDAHTTVDNYLHFNDELRISFDEVHDEIHATKAAIDNGSWFKAGKNKEQDHRITGAGC